MQITHYTMQSEQTIKQDASGDYVAMTALMTRTKVVSLPYSAYIMLRKRLSMQQAEANTPMLLRKQAF